jgi:hypothetical protein
MAHHGSEPSPEIRDLFRNAFPEMDQSKVLGDLNRAIQSEELKLGATHRFPEGKLTKDDEGEIRVAIGQKDGKVVIDFGKPTAWIGFTPEQADDIAKLLHEHATEARLRR